MSQLPTTHEPPIALGMLSLVLGTVGLLLFFLPILGWPISAFGLFFGLLGIVVSFSRGGVSLRWSFMGSAVSALALSINLAIYSAPGGYLPEPFGRPLWQSVPDRPYVPPPAKP
jgi:hypothetical protein